MSIPFLRRWLHTEKEGLDYFTCASVYDSSEAQRTLQASGIICPDFRHVIQTMIRYYRNHKDNVAKQIPIQ
ncbi:hypothetical protein [Thermaerobacillus caldiproteolyticus]|uniref:hypothetical protein n=1 Tax=Thermaerobacillus caldiproteolyticus TaxID=247480 RepID=UPI0015EB6269|nr:hypothetical protein [Anoxybacillus caldiproteolyticus]